MMHLLLLNLFDDITMHALVDTTNFSDDKMKYSGETVRKFGKTGGHETFHLTRVFRRERNK